MTNALLSDRIENFILEMLERQTSDVLMIKRKEMADLLECAPSQITYVINTRFSGNKRFLVESRRGSGGYIKIAMREISKKGDLKPQVSNKSPENNRPEKNSTGTDIESIENSLNGYFQMLIDYEIISVQEYRIVRSMLRTMLEFCAPEQRKQAAKTVIHRLEWTLKGE